MSFESSKNKLVTIWNGSIENQFKINRSSSNSTIILNKVQSLNRTDTSLKSVVELSSDWLNPSFIQQEDDEENLIWIVVAQDFFIEINNIHKTLIPYITSKISYRIGEGSPSLPIPDALDSPGTPFDESMGVNINDFIEIKDIVTESRNIIYHCSIYLYDDNGLPKNLQFKFYTFFLNPRTYTSN